MIESSGVWLQEFLNNFGDLPFHISVITSFAFGNNFPPEDPTYAGVHFTYPFLTDFVSAILFAVAPACGSRCFWRTLSSRSASLLWFTAGRWCYLRIASQRLLHPVGTAERRLRLDAVMDRDEAKRHGVTGGVEALPPSVTVIPDTTWRWGNAVSTLLVPQRGMLLGLALAVIVFTQWWLSEEKGEEGKGVGEK